MFGRKKNVDADAGSVVKAAPRRKETGPSFLARSIAIIQEIVEARLNHYFGKTDKFIQPAFDVVDDGSVFARYVIDSKIID